MATKRSCTFASLSKPLFKPPASLTVHNRGLECFALLCFALYTVNQSLSTFAGKRSRVFVGVALTAFTRVPSGKSAFGTAPAHLGGSSAWNFGNIPPPFFEVIVTFSGGGAKREKTQTWLRTEAQSRPSLDFVQIPHCDLSGGLEQRGRARRLSLNLFSFHPLICCYECGWTDFFFFG